MRTILMLLAVGFAAAPAFAQSTPYHLHNESSPNFFFHGTLKTAGPDVAGVTFQSPDLKGRPLGTTNFKNFETLAGIGVGGVIPAKSTIAITLYMRKTAAFGVIAPTVNVNYSRGSLCTATGPALGTVMGAVVFNCVTGASSVSLISPQSGIQNAIPPRG